MLYRRPRVICIVVLVQFAVISTTESMNHSPATHRRSKWAAQLISLALKAAVVDSILKRNIKIVKNQTKQNHVNQDGRQLKWRLNLTCS